MVYIHFPSQYTEEEEMLQKKYQKLKKKKKALQQLKAPKQEPSPIQNPLKCTSEAKQDAKEVAKKLLKSGAISAIKVENKERQGFKRPKTLERRRSGPEKPTLAGYHPFSATHPMDESPEPNAPAAATANQPAAAIKNLYESFVTSHKLNERDPERAPNEQQRERRVHSKPDVPQKGNTLYVHGNGVSEEILKKAFNPYGHIMNISMEMDKNCGFVTYESMDSADKAISELNGRLVLGIQLRVSIARKQPLITNPPDRASAALSSWASRAGNTPSPANKPSKDRQQEKRSLVVYNDDLF